MLQRQRKRHKNVKWSKIREGKLRKMLKIKNIKSLKSNSNTVFKKIIEYSDCFKDAKNQSGK